MITDPIYDAVVDAIVTSTGLINDDFELREFESILAEYGFMIVPIEDPTNLRFGADE